MHPGYYHHQPDLLATCCDEAVRRKYWETTVRATWQEYFAVRLCQGIYSMTQISTRDVLTQSREIVGRSRVMQTTRQKPRSLEQSLDIICIIILVVMEILSSQGFFRKARVFSPRYCTCCSVHISRTGAPDIMYPHVPNVCSSEAWTCLWCCDSEDSLINKDQQPWPII